MGRRPEVAERRTDSSTQRSERSLIAYRTTVPQMRLVPASAARAWMDATPNRLAYRCLPMLVANQAGWFILNTHRLVAVWTGRDDPASLKIVYPRGMPPYPATSHFGSGILTWNIPYLFRTPPGYNLLARGPANWPKDGAYPLEGLIETDWTEAPFTMNWKLTRPNRPVVFDVDEPICMIVPQRRGELEAFRPYVGDLGADPDLRREFAVWSAARARFQAEARVPGSAAARQGWQRHYFRGSSVTGRRAPAHQLKLQLRDFSELDAGPPAAARPDDTGS